MMGKDVIDPSAEEEEELAPSGEQQETTTAAAAAWPAEEAPPSIRSSSFRGQLIPNIVIDPIPPRDAFGHSHTPPFLQRSASDQPLSFRWSLGPPLNGKKTRAHSDSSIMEMERSFNPNIPPPREFHTVREFQLPQAELGSGSICRGEPRTMGRGAQTMQPTSSSSSSSPKPMDTSNGDQASSTVHSLSPHHFSMEVMESKGQNPAFHSPTEKSPKMYWLRRHSDSNVSTADEPEAKFGTDPGPSPQRSQSTVDPEEGKTITSLGEPDQSMLSRSPTEGHKIFSMKKYLQERYILDKGLESGSGMVRTRHDSSESVGQGMRQEKASVVMAAAAERSTITPDLIERQVSSGFTVRESQTSEDMPCSPPQQEVKATKPKDDQYPPLPLRRHPKLTLKETIPLKTEPISPCESDVETPVFFSPSFISPRVFSESPRWHHVFQFPSARGRQMSPLAAESRAGPQPHLRRSCSSSDVMSSLRGEMLEPVVQAAETITRPPEEAMEQVEFPQQKQQQQQHPLQHSPVPRGIDPTRLSPPRFPGMSVRRHHRAVGRSRSEGHTPSHPLSPSPQSTSGSSAAFLQHPSIGSYEQADLSPGSSTLSPAGSSLSPGSLSPSGPLPPFSTMVQQPQPPPHGLPMSPGIPPPFTSYRTSSPTLSPRPFWSGSPGSGLPISPTEVSPEREASASMAASASYQSMPLSPTATTSSAGSSHPTGRKTDASKMIYCPFGDKIREQRMSQDPSSVFRCPVCSQLFPSYYYLANHMVNHLPSEVVSKGPGDSNKVHLCKVCNRSFSRSDMLTRHMRLHTGLKPYECQICGQVFSRSDHLHTHARTHTGEKPYKCPQCPYAAPRRDMITRHMRIHAKHFSRRGRRSSSTGSDITPQSSTESVEVKRRNQSLSSIESVDSDPPLRLGSADVLEHSGVVGAVLEEEDNGKARNWSLTSGDSAESSEIIPSTTGSRNWSLASTESGESPYQSSRSFSLEGSSDPYAARAMSWLPPPDDKSLSPSDTISAEVQSSFQKCTVASDKESTGSSDNHNTLSPSSSVVMETEQSDKG